MKQITHYIDVLKLGSKSDNTIRSYTKDLHKLVSYFNIEDASELDKLEVADFHKLYASQNVSPNSLKSLIRNLSAFFSWLAKSKIISKDNAFFQVDFGGSKFPKIIKKKKTILTQEEAEALVNAGRNLQEKFMLRLMITTALRRDEVCNIKMTDIRGCAISIKSKGGDEDDETYLNEQLCQMLQEYLKERNTDSEYLFYGTRGFDGDKGKLTGTSINNRVKACAKLSGIPEEKVKVTSAHRLRAFAITQMYIKKGMEAAQALGRHENQETTKAYVTLGNEFVKGLLLGDNE